jgi:hypothetical protein
MNKGLFAHIVATIIYILLTLFVIQGENIILGGRLLIVVILLFINFVVAAISDINDWYKHKI